MQFGTPHRKTFVGEMNYFLMISLIVLAIKSSTNCLLLFLSNDQRHTKNIEKFVGYNTINWW